MFRNLGCNELQHLSACALILDELKAVFIELLHVLLFGNVFLGAPIEETELLVPVLQFRSVHRSALFLVVTLVIDSVRRQDLTLSLL